MSWKPVILCVDDTPSVLEGQKMLLEENGYRVLTATNGKEAVQAFTTHSVDLVLLDYHMPEMNGGMAAVRMKDSKPDVPVALLSSDECLPLPDYLLSLRFLFRPFDALKARGTGDGADTHEAGPESDRPDGISMKNDGIPRGFGASPAGFGNRNFPDGSGVPHEHSPSFGKPGRQNSY